MGSSPIEMEFCPNTIKCIETEDWEEIYYVYSVHIPHRCEMNEYNTSIPKRPVHQGKRMTAKVQLS